MSGAGLLILKTGEAPPEIIAQFGDFERWCLGGLGLQASQATVVDARQGAPLPAPRHYAAVLVTGSAAMVTEGAAWSEAAARWLASVLRAEVPLLGICFGHQLLAHAAGGQVGDNPAGLRLGTVRARLTAHGRADALFGGLPPRPWVQVTHRQSVLRLPPGARLLASAAHDPHLAFALGQRAWGVQFHPEFDAAITRAYLRQRQGWVRQHGQDPEALARGVRASPAGAALLERFWALATAR